jgi:hypothetical protein
MDVEQSAQPPTEADLLVVHIAPETEEVPLPAGWADDDTDDSDDEVAESPSPAREEEGRVVETPADAVVDGDGHVA